MSQGIIDSSQESRIRSFYSSRPEYNRLINTVISLGSILIGLGIILFIASNWQKIPKLSKVLIIFSAITLFHLASYYFRYIKDRYLGLSEGFLIIGSFAFGAGIWLIAQIYQIHYNFSAGILFWIIGILPIVFICRSWTVLSLSSLLSLIWLFSYQAYYYEREAYGVFLLLAVLVWLSYYIKQRFSLFISIAIVFYWIIHFWMIKCENLAYAGLSAQIMLVSVLSFFGFLLYALGMQHEKLKNFNIFAFLYKFIGVLIICISAYSLTFSHHYDNYIGLGCKPVFNILLVFFVLLPLALLHKMSKAEDPNDAKESGYVLMLLCVSALGMCLGLTFPKTTSWFYNLALLLNIFVLMYLSFLRHSEGVFRLIIIIFFIDVLSRYFDTLWKMMPRSLLFMLGGVILIVGSILADNARRKIEAKMHRG